MARSGLIGHPLGHSFSKAYFTEKYNVCYENYDLDDLGALHALLQQHPDLCGFNVTIPYKEAILPYLDILDPVAAEVGAVNTVKVMGNGQLKGYNTDVIGIEKTLHGDHAMHLLGLNKPFALLLGTGGASKAVQYVLRHKNLPYHIVSRSIERGHYTYTDVTPEIIQNHQLIINATPVGMAPHFNEAPMIPYEALTTEHVLFDLIYNPEETRFLKHGREQGATIINGLTMLHAQAEASWAIWNQE